MPTISFFHGIRIKMNTAERSQHNLPHIHAFCGDDEAVVGFDGKLIRGFIPSNKMKLLKSWIKIHLDELKANWIFIMDGEPVYKIQPLD